MINNILLVFGALSTFIVSLTALWKAVAIQKKVEEVHVLLNSRLTELVEATKRLADNEGFSRGVQESERVKSTPSAQE